MAPPPMAVAESSHRFIRQAIRKILEHESADRSFGEGFERLVRRFTAVPDDERVCATIISFEEQMRGWLGQIAAARSHADLQDIVTITKPGPRGLYKKRTASWDTMCRLLGWRH